MLPIMTDRRTVQLVILILGIFAIAGLAGIVYLIDSGSASESVSPLVALVGPAIGAVGAMLVSTRSVDVPGIQAVADLQARADANGSGQPGGPGAPEQPAEVVIRAADDPAPPPPME